MKQILLLFCLLKSVFIIGQTNIYSKSFGNSNDDAIIFIHGGPSGNSTLFEYTTAEKLSEKGFFVIIYDRRGEGRSIDSLATFTYQECFNDLNNLYEKYNIKRANVIAHSFGGLIATLYSEKYPQKIKSLILSGALFSQQETYDNILKTTTKIYNSDNDIEKLKEIVDVKKLNKNSAEYRKKCFDLAYENKFFEMPKPTKSSENLRQEYDKTIFNNNIRNKNAAKIFYRNETLKNIDTKSNMKRLKTELKIFAIYGKEDKIFGESQLKKIKKIVGKTNFTLIENCSHYLFVDQQEIFIENIVNWLKK
jgi:proline iminopeptidase